MNLHYHFSVMGFSNTYIISKEDSCDAILIDPGVMDVPLLKIIEGNNLYIRNILVTHSHESHIKGLGTILKIYDADVYAGSKHIGETEVNRIDPDQDYSISGFDVETFIIPGHSSDSMVFKIGNLLFTGDILGAGKIGSTPNRYARVMMIEAIQNKLFTLPEDCIILPGHGAPSTIRTEKLYNPSLSQEL